MDSSLPVTTTKSSNKTLQFYNSSNAPWRGKCKRKFYRLAIVTSIYLVVFGCITVLKAVNSSGFQLRRAASEVDSGISVHGDLVRIRRDLQTTSDRPPITPEEDTTRNCTPRSVHNFPPNFLTFKETQDGGVVLHILVSLYMFAALAIVCDDYFVPSLEHICEDLGLQADVAGATFMAAGSSAPEFMTSVVGVFFAESDVGVGTIVGSAVFNILFIIGVCGVFAGMVVELTWYPLIRDSVFYLISVLTLFLIIRDKHVHWYEATTMIFLYMVYIVLMYFNRKLESTSRAWVRNLMSKFGRQPLVDKPSACVIPDDMKRARAHRHDMELISLPNSGYCESRISQSSMTMSMSREYEKPIHGVDQALQEEQETTILETDAEPTPTTSQTQTDDFTSGSEYESVWQVPENVFLKVLWVLLIPAKCVFYVTIPDSRRPGIWSKLYLMSFVLSVAWISGLTYIMVWMVTIAGDVLDIPDTVMGLTLLAAGTSVPDCLASIFVARDGYGDMAVSNSLGSNVFDILLCLGIPWVIACARRSGDSVVITSEGLTYSALTLLVTIAFLLVSMGVNNFKLNKTYGGLCLVVYVFVIILSCLYELNVFGEFNPPTCDR